MKLKTVEVDGKVYAEVNDGKPVYVEDDGKETAFDAVSTKATISRLFGENKSYRERAESAESKAKQFEGIEDPQAARKALETVKNLDDKKLVDAGEVEKIKSEVGKVYETKLAEETEKREKLEQQLHAEKIGGGFARSKFIADKLAIPSDLVQARFGSAFKVEDGDVIAYDANGNKIFSRSNPGAAAGFDEALEFLIEQYPQKDQILKGSGQSGSGAKSGGGGGGQGLKRSEMDSAAKAKYIEEHGQQAYLQLPK
ncbi:DUF6651 domain-containing protein [Paracandidimonas soli]|uniref:DUF6651 domain-containing protein n=1 Tax=Paracandidimonas soli TaxID=1917182 RepID=A0A4R3ULB7_9BURK|nr:DUF6651 domain-containing protein [Paracandidimonas soli]TCU91622.1 hypothetical protein EV686_11718 [Paracandidimonas soli]